MQREVLEKQHNGEAKDQGKTATCEVSVSQWMTNITRSQTQAKQFQDGTKKASELSYDVDYSTLGTQSCAQRIPAKGARTIYLAFENERIRYANYIWVEVMTAVLNTEYHHTRYYVE